MRKLVAIKPIALNNAGFTMVELMIATLIFSTVLVAITFGTISFTNSYYQGVNAAATQNAARNLMQTVTNAIQFNGADVQTAMTAGKVTTYCVGTTQFDFNLGQEYGTNTTNPHVVWTSVNDAAGGCTPHPYTDGYKELLGPHLRLSNFAITTPTGTTGIQNVTIRVAYGDDDLLKNFDTTTAQCISQEGSQFCAVSELTTTIQMRLGGTN